MPLAIKLVVLYHFQQYARAVCIYSRLASHVDIPDRRTSQVAEHYMWPFLTLILYVAAYLIPSFCTAILHAAFCLFSGISHLITHCPSRRTSMISDALLPISPPTLWLRPNMNRRQHNYKPPAKRPLNLFSDSALSESARCRIVVHISNYIRKLSIEKNT